MPARPPKTSVPEPAVARSGARPKSEATVSRCAACAPPHAHNASASTQAWLLSMQRRHGNRFVGRMLKPASSFSADTAAPRLQRAPLDPSNTAAWDWYGKDTHRKDASYLQTVEAAKGAAGDTAKALAAKGVPATKEDREAFEAQVKTLIRLNGVTLVGQHRAGLAARKAQFEAMMTKPPASAAPGATPASDAPSTQTDPAADTATAIRAAAELVRKLNTERTFLTGLQQTASSAVRVNDGSEAIPSELETLRNCAEPRSSAAVLMSVMTANARMKGLSGGSKKVQLMNLSSEIVNLRKRQIDGLQLALAAVYDAFPIFAIMPATFPATGKEHESSTARKVAAGIGVASLMVSPLAPLALWLAKDEFKKDAPPDDATLLSTARSAFERLLGNTDEAIVKIGSGGIEPLDLPGAVTATRNALAEPLRPELDRVKQEHEVAKFTEEMMMALGIAVLTGLTGGLAGLGFTALAATAGAAGATAGAVQLGTQASDMANRQTIAAASTSPDGSLLGVSAPTTFEWAMLGVNAALTALDLVMVAKELAAVRPHFRQEPQVGAPPKDPHAPASKETDPAAPKSEPGALTPKQPGTAGAAESAQSRILEAGRGDAVPSMEQIDSELAIVKTTEPREAKVKGYVDEVELGNGHTWRRDADGNWCRFSKTPVCVPGGKTGTASRSSAGVIKSEQDIDTIIMPRKPRIDAPPPTVKTPQDQQYWELYNSYFDERVASMRQDFRSESGTTKRNVPMSFDEFRETCIKNPELIKAMRGRLSQGETGKLLNDITNGSVAQNLGISKVADPGVGDVVYPDFVFKRAQGDGYSVVSQKRRDFAGMKPEEVRSQVMKDIAEGLEKYYGNRYVRRRGLDVTGEPIRLDELILNYDVRSVPEKMRPQMREIGAAYPGVDVKVGFFEL